MGASDPLTSYSKCPDIGHRGLHIWRASLRCPPELLRRYAAKLSPEEEKRAAKFLVKRAKEDFVAGRGILRELLSRYLRQDPSAIRFTYGEQGKPALFISADHSSSLQFNVSHSNGFAVFAFAAGARVGIDVEQVRADFPGEQIAELYFAEEESAEIRTLPEERRAAGFFTIWTGKEAYLKARGEGLQTPLRNFQISISKNGPQELLDERGSLWTVYRLDAMKGFAGAVAAEGNGWILRYFDWPGDAGGAERESSMVGAAKSAGGLQAN
jgi:4'-phosphopantetheinyl transferase